MNEIILPAFLWSGLIAVMDLILYPLVAKPGVPGCDVPPQTVPYSGQHFKNAGIMFVAFFIIGLVAFGLRRFFNRRWLVAIVMSFSCLMMSAMLHDMDYPACNSFSPLQSWSLALGVYMIPSAFFWLMWMRRRKTD